MELLFQVLELGIQGVEPFREYLAFDMVPPQYMEQEDIPAMSDEVEDRRTK